MAERGMLPECFARRSRHGTPLVGIMFSASGVILLSWLSFQEIVAAENFLYCFGMIMEFIAFVKLRIDHPAASRPYKVPVGTAGAILMCVAPTLLILVVLALASFKVMGLSLFAILIGLVLQPCLKYTEKKRWLRFSENAHKLSKTEDFRTGGRHRRQEYGCSQKQPKRVSKGRQRKQEYGCSQKRPKRVKVDREAGVWVPTETAQKSLQSRNRLLSDFFLILIPSMTPGGHHIANQQMRDSFSDFLLYLHYTFTDPSESPSQQNLKRDQLLELLSTIKSLKKPLPDEILSPLFTMIATNLFRPLSPPTPPSSVLPDDDDLVATPAAAWPHLHIVYDILLRLVWTWKPRHLVSILMIALFSVCSPFSSPKMQGTR
ncbi:UNVERIFIED_CONTAM: Polyamine transporter RMV1 [Sesamum radiatum]|uniref:Polyamine transporter RMV1 n=1 Tax=Sesamum radiatum TaxID=300843 RepID=A0AAW2RUS9_SESRA